VFVLVIGLSIEDPGAHRTTT